MAIDNGNKPQTVNKAPASGSKAGVESGLGMVESLTRGALQPEQESHGANFTQNSIDSPVAGKNGKQFRTRY